MPPTGTLQRAVDLLSTARRPIVYGGGGLVNSGAAACEAFRRLVHRLDAPCTLTLMGLGAFPASDSHFVGMLGIVQAKGRPVRAVALTDAASGKTLAARLLPFVGNDQQDVAGATLVYQAGGFSVFEIAPAAATAAAAPEAGRSQP